MLKPSNRSGSALLGGILAASVFVIFGFANGCQEVKSPPDTPATTVVTATAEPTTEPEGQEIIVDELETNVPNVTPPDTLSLKMREEIIDGKGPLDRCHDYGGELTLDMICHGVDY